MRIKYLLSLLLITSLMTSCKEAPLKIEYAGIDLSDRAEILRDKDSKKARFRTDLNEQWALYAGSSVDSIKLNEPILKGKEAGNFPLEISEASKSYFLLVTESGQAILSEKHLPMAGGFNFRDMGGLKNQEGRYVQWGKVFRADDLSKLTDQDLSYLSTIPLTTVVDFRSESEIKEGADRLPQSVKNHLLLSINPGSLNAASLGGIREQIAKVGAVEMMKEINRSLSTDSAQIDQYRKFFDALQSDSEVPLLFHCTAGKDRTGMGAALFLYSLGVDEKIIFDDYLKSNIYLKDKYAEVNKTHPELAPMFGVNSEYLEAGIDEIIKNHGSVESYLKNVLKVDLEKMKEKFLY